MASECVSRLEGRLRSANKLQGPTAIPGSVQLAKLDIFKIKAGTALQKMLADWRLLVPMFTQSCVEMSDCLPDIGSTASGATNFMNQVTTEGFWNRSFQCTKMRFEFAGGKIYIEIPKWQRSFSDF